jgi:DNA-binding transcriptional ArsR family regulator
MHSEIAVAALAALGHDLRFEVWRLLVPHGPAGLSAGTLSALLAVAPSSLSFHLQQLTQCGILVQRRSSRQIIYAVNSEVIAALCHVLAKSGGAKNAFSGPALAGAESGNVIGER